MEAVVNRPKLSEGARRSLKERLRTLEDEQIPLLERELAESGDPLIDTALRAMNREVAVVRHALANERFTLVGELEARLDQSWMSVESPLGSALLGSRTGESVDVKTPDGLVTWEVLAIDGRVDSWSPHSRWRTPGSS